MSHTDAHPDQDGDTEMVEIKEQEEQTIDAAFEQSSNAGHEEEDLDISTEVEGECTQRGHGPVRDPHELAIISPNDRRELASVYARTNMPVYLHESYSEAMQMPMEHAPYHLHSNCGEQTPIPRFSEQDSHERARYGAMRVKHWNLYSAIIRMELHRNLTLGLDRAVSCRPSVVPPVIPSLIQDKPEASAFRPKLQHSTTRVPARAAFYLLLLVVPVLSPLKQNQPKASEPCLKLQHSITLVPHRMTSCPSTVVFPFLPPLKQQQAKGSASTRAGRKILPKKRNTGTRARRTPGPDPIAKTRTGDQVLGALACCDERMVRVVQL